MNTFNQARLNEPFQLASPVGMMQVPWEMNRLQEIYQKRQPKLVVEIGTLLGGTLFGWITFATPGTHIIAIDPDIPFEREKLWRTWLPSDVRLTVLRGRSQDVVHQLPETEINWLYIDGSHAYPDVKADFENYGAKVNHGLIIFHDVYTIGRLYAGYQGCEVWRLWDDIRREGYVTQELGVHSDYFGTGIIYKGLL